MSIIRANGISLEIERHGSSDRVPILLIRGLGSQLIHWPRDLLTGLVEAGYHVVTFDNRDAGLSQKMDDAPDYALSDMARDAVGVLDGLGIVRAHVLGLSMGGMIAQRMALQAPQRLISATVVMSSSRAPGLKPAAPEVQAALSSQARSPDRDDVISHELVTGRLWQSPGWPFDIEERTALIGRAYDRCYCPDGVTRQYAAIERSGQELSGIEAIATPMLVLHGRQDTLLPPEHGRDIARRVPGAKLVEIEGMGHDLEGELPGIVLSHLLPFLETTERAGNVPKE